jgi:hypothetical protein
MKEQKGRRREKKVAKRMLFSFDFHVNLVVRSSSNSSSSSSSPQRNSEVLYSCFLGVVGF